MTLFGAPQTATAAGQLALGALLGVAAFALLLPRPKGRSVAGGTAAAVASAAVLVAWALEAFGGPGADPVQQVLFWLFAAGAVGFGVVLVAQRNPARGAIAFAFVVLSTCGLFLLLAAPFLMAVTIIVYAGAIIVTFLFVLMLSNVAGPSDENDRSREPLLGSLAGFAFTGLILFTLYQSKLAAAPAVAEKPGALPPAASPLPAATVTDAERAALADVVARLTAAEKALADPLAPAARQGVVNDVDGAKGRLAEVVGTSPRDEDAPISEGSLRERLGVRHDAQAAAVARRADDLQAAALATRRAVENNLLGPKPDQPAAAAAVAKLRDETLLLYGSGELPARNVGNLGLLLYADQLLAIELAGTLLLVATIGAVVIAQRKGAAR